MGTRFLATKEVMVDEAIKQDLVKRGLSRTAFAVQSAYVEEQMGKSVRPHGVRLSVWSCGAVAGLIDDVPSCEELMERMVAEAVDVIETLPTQVLHPQI